MGQCTAVARVLGGHTSVGLVLLTYLLSPTNRTFAARTSLGQIEFACSRLFPEAETPLIT